MPNLSMTAEPRRLLLLLSVASAALLAGAWFFQLVIGLQPCKLCLEQRWPHYAMLALGILALVDRDGRLARWLLGLAALILAGSVALAVYHAGVEWGWFAGPNDCAGAPPPVAAGMQDFMAQLSKTRVVSCTEAAWRFAGLSLAGWNAVASLGLLLVAVRGLAAARRPSPGF